MQERNEFRWRPGQEATLSPPCSNLRSFGSKCTVLQKVHLWHCWDLSGPPAVIWCPRSDSAPGELFPPCPPRYAPEPRAPLAAPMSRTQSTDSSKAWSNLENLQLLIVTWRSSSNIMIFDVQIKLLITFFCKDCLQVATLAQVHEWTLTLLEP